MKKRRLSILLSIVMLLSLLPTTAFAASYAKISVNDIDLQDGEYLADNSSTSAQTATAAPSTYVAWYKDGTLTLKGYNGKGIETKGVAAGELTVKLIGTNSINNGSLVSDNGGNIIVTSDSRGTLSISKITSGSNPAIGIETGLASGYTTGNVTIKGNAEVTITMTHNGTSTYERAYGIYAKDSITISESASVDITCATPKNTTGGGNCNGLYANQDVTIDTNGKIEIDVRNAGEDSGYSFGVYPVGTAKLTKVGEMEVQWKKHKTNTSYPGGAVYKGTSFAANTHAINAVDMDETKCYASYRHGTPYEVTVENGELIGPGVPNKMGSGMFLVNDTVNITPSVMKGKSGEEIPFQKWTSEEVTFTDPTAENNSFAVPANAVTVTAKHSPFVGTPTFMPIGTIGTEGTLTFKTKVNTHDGSEGFALVNEADVNDTGKYKSINPSTTSLSSTYEYSGTVNFNNFPAGNYYVAEKLNGAWYLSDLFAVDYTAAPTPTANISLSQTSTMDFGSKEAGYTTAPTAETVTITNNGTAATDALTIALEGTHATSFTLSKTSITDIAADGTDTFTVQPKTGLSAGTHTATVKVSGTGTGVTEQSFNVKFTVTAQLTPIAVPTANTGLVYNGTKQTGVNTGTDYTLGGIYEAIDVGATDYTATATLDSGYKWTDDTTDAKTIKWNIGKRTPTAADFDFAAPTDLTYDGTDKTAIVTLKSPLTKSGAINVKYEKDGTPVNKTMDVGTYTVKIDVAGGDNFNADSNLTDSAWTFSITPANQSAPTGLGVAAPTASGGNGKITGTTTAMEYSTDSGFASLADCSATATEVAPGTYYVRYKADANHNAGAAETVTVPDYSATKYAVTVTSDANGTASADMTSAVAGETVTLTATPNSGYVFDQWTDKTPTILVIGADGKFTMPGENVIVKATFTPAALIGTASITGNLKYDQELTASLAGGNNTGTLTYTWYRSGETTAIATNTTGKYTLTADDIGKTITVKISSDVQTGEITSSATGTIEKADAPAAPAAFTLSFTPNSDGTTFTATIPTVVGGEYSFDGTNYSAANTKADCAANISYTGYVRIAATYTHKASTATSDTQTAPKLTVATPTFTPSGASSFSGTQSVTITCTTAGAKIYYTTDDTTPTASSTPYTTALTLTSTTTVKAIAVKTDMNNSAVATAVFTKASGTSGGSSGGGYVPTTQKPEIKAAAGGKAELSKDGTTLTITADAGKVIDKVLLNGKDMGAVSELKGLKTGDKVEVIFKDQVTEPTKEELDKAAKEAAGELVLPARSAKLKNGSVKVVVKADLKAITDAGYTVKYKFYRSTKKSAGYKAMKTGKSGIYINTYGKKGTMYYYKARVMIYDKEGNFVAQTALKQCKYANRLWTK